VPIRPPIFDRKVLVLNKPVLTQTSLESCPLYPQKADIGTQLRNVRFVPEEADIVVLVFTRIQTRSRLRIPGGEASKRDDRHGEPSAGSGKQCVRKRQPEHGLIFREMAMIKQAAGKNDMSKRILVVDDQPDNRQIIRDMLAPTDYEITEAENGELALAAIAKQRPDLILMDIQLPIMDGYTATSRIKSDPKLQSIPIIAVTSYALSGEDRKARAAGCDECVAKPFSPRHLLPKIRHYLQ
jgi:two-component system, cell cycle response regulator DivK